jgi:hypothetical protein
MLTNGGLADIGQLAARNQVARIYLDIPGHDPDSFALRALLQFHCYRSPPDYLTFLNPDIQCPILCFSGPKILAFSIDQAIWSREFQAKPRGRDFFRRVENLFLEMNCVYAYAHTPPLPIGGPYDRICDHGGHSGKRIMDFDYAQKIEGIYEYNVLSPEHIGQIPDGLENLENCESIEVREIVSTHGNQRRNTVIQVNDSNGIDIVTEHLDVLIDRTPEPWLVEKNYLLVRRPEELPQFALNAACKAFEPVSVALFPHDFVEIALPRQVSPSDSMAHTGELQDFFRIVCPRLLDANIWVHEELQQFAGLFDRQAIFRRIPHYEKLNTNFLKIRFASKIKFDSLEVNLLLKKKPSATSTTEITALIAQWHSDVNTNADVYGKLRFITDVKQNLIGQAHGFHFLVDASKVRQSAVNLLVLMLDQLNSRSFLVQFLVFGRIRI